ncbi:hypothetical protein LVJ94_38455 [Pendulispora rubella]|uniref:Uncharacterized protein n=1 Tax=Pendulispora rubella TaxID=2741070 RepID=A0ABZ2KVS6_9BACT
MLLAGSLLFACSLEYLSRDFGKNGGGGDISDAGGSDQGQGAPGGSYCATLSHQATFCDDFEKGLDPSWRTTAEGGGSVLPAKRAAAIRVPSGGTNAYAYLEKDFTQKAGGVSLEFALTAPSLAGQSKAYETVRIELPNGGGTSQISLTLEDDSDTPDHLAARVKEHHRYADGGIKDSGFGVKVPFPIDSVVRVSLEITFGTPTRVVVAFDGSTNEGNLAVVISPASSAKVLLGIVQPELTNNGWDLLVDDVVIDLLAP